MNTRMIMGAGACALVVLACATACSGGTTPGTTAASGPARVSGSAAPKAAPATPAQALPSPDPSDYLYSIRLTTKLPGDGVAQLAQGAASDAELLKVGGHICTELRGHVPPAQVEKELEGAWTRPSALLLLGAASGQFSSLCPDQHDTVAAYVQSLQ